MKYNLITIISLLILISCGKSNKEQPIKNPTLETVKKEEGLKEETNVSVDSNGVANVLITSNDGMRFDIRKIKVNAGQKIRLTLNHTGKLDKKIMGHNIVFLKNQVKPSKFAVKAAAAKDNDYIPEETSDVIAHTKMIGGGESAMIEFTAPEKGVYNYICSFPGHFAMMKGKLIVE